jgi:hypothetical protein
VWSPKLSVLPSVKVAIEAEFVAMSAAKEALVDVNAPEIFASNAYELVTLVKVFILFIFVAIEAEFAAISVAIEALVLVNAPEIFTSSAYELVTLVKVLMLVVFVAIEAEFVVISVAIEALVEVNAPEMSVAIWAEEESNPLKKLDEASCVNSPVVGL